MEISVNAYLTVAHHFDLLTNTFWNQVFWCFFLLCQEARFQRLVFALCQLFFNPPQIMSNSLSCDYRWHAFEDSRPVAFYSLNFIQSEKNYCTLDKENLALYLCVKCFRPYVYGVLFQF